MAKKKQVIQVKGREIRIVLYNNESYISLTDLAESDRFRIYSWMRNRNTLEMLRIWEELYNPDFNRAGFDTVTKNAGLNTFRMSANAYIEATNGIGIISKAGRYGGTYAHPDIALDFASWLSPGFRLYVLKEYRRLKEEESRRLSINWNLKRELSKINYRLHTETVRQFLVPKDWEEKFKVGGIYANEADMFNIAVFGMTAREWKGANPDEKGNIRDQASELELIVLTNLEAINSELIKEALPAEERFLRLRAIAQYQLVVLNDDTGIQKFLPPEDV